MELTVLEAQILTELCFTTGGIYNTKYATDHHDIFIHDYFIHTISRVAVGDISTVSLYDQNKVCFDKLSQGNGRKMFDIRLLFQALYSQKFLVSVAAATCYNDSNLSLRSSFDLYSSSVFLIQIASYK